MAINADLARRTSGKLRRNGWTYDDVLNCALAMIVSVRGKPSFMNANPETDYRFDDLRPEVKDALREGKEILDGTRPAKWFDSTADLIREIIPCTGTGWGMRSAMSRA